MVIPRQPSEEIVLGGEDARRGSRRDAELGEDVLHVSGSAVARIWPRIQQARKAGLGVTIHVGEEGGDYGIAEIREVVSTLRPDRIGHGILAARDKRLMGQISEAGIVPELCPTSNLLTKALESEEALRDTFRAFAECGVQFTIATDGPEMSACICATSSSSCCGSVLSTSRS